MMAAEFKATLDALGVNQARFGRLLGYERGTVNRWAMGAVPVPQHVAVLLKILASTDISVDEIEGWMA